MARIPRGLPSERPSRPPAESKTGWYSDLHDYLVAGGYSYKSSVGDDKLYQDNAGNVALVKKIASGRPAQRVDIPISENMRLVRLHATPDTYQIIMGQSQSQPPVPSSPTSKGLSSIQSTIVEQLKAQNPDFVSHWNVQAIFGIIDGSKEGIQISTNNHGRVVNYQILYNSGEDTYEVKAFKVDANTADVQEVYRNDDIYWDNLFSAMQSGEENARVGLKASVPKTNTPLIWRWSIGHYGGYYVDVPAENFEAFKAMFQGGTFPRKVKEESVAETIGDSATEIRFDKTFPNSRGRYYQVYFADRSKGEQILDHSNVLHTNSAEKPDLSD